VSGLPSIARVLCILSLVNFIANSSLRAEVFADRIEAIQVVGNEKTKTSVVESLSHLEIDDEVTEKLLNDAKDRIKSSGLFEEVEVERLRSPNARRVIIRLRVKEKTSWFVAPSLQFSTNALTGGFVFGESNLLGHNKKALVFADYGPSARRFVLAYRDPAVWESDLTLTVDSIFRWDRMIEYQDRTEVRRVRLLDYGATILPGYRWSQKFVSSVGAYYRNVDEKLKSESQALNRVSLRKGYDVAIVVKFEYDDTTNYDGLFHGARTSLESTLSDNRFFSDFDYNKEEIRFSSGLVFMNREYNWQNHMSIQLGQNLPYYREYTSGGNNLRGYIDRQFRGDTKYSLSEEFYYPIHNFNRIIVRGVLFYDTNVIYFKDAQFSRDAWKNGMGGGLRFYLKGIVIPLIGFDAAWGAEDHTYATYLSVGATF